MKHALSVSFRLAIAVTFLAGVGCSNDRESAARDDEQEVTGPAHLPIQAGDSLLFSPVASPDRELSLPGDISDSLVVAFSFIEPAVSLSDISSYSGGELVHLSLDENLTITARIDRNQPVGDTIRTITGTILEPHTGNIMLTVNRDMLSGTIDVLSPNRLFYIRYDRESAMHYLAEINRARLDIQENSPPLELN
jgi:hypothetical protein